MGKVISFFGADHKCGTSMIAQCIAEAAAKMYPGKTVLLVHAQGDRGSDYSAGVRESMEHMMPYLAEHMIDSEEVKRTSRWKDNLHIIGSAETPESVSGFLPDMAEFFIIAMKKSFDLIICDCGSQIEHGLTLGSLFASDKIFIVLNQKENTVKRYEWFKPLYTKLMLNIDGFVVNMFSRDSAFSKSYLAKRLEIEGEKFVLIRHDRNGENAEITGESLLEMSGGKGFKKDIKMLADAIAEYSFAMGDSDEPVVV